MSSTDSSSGSDTSPPRRRAPNRGKAPATSEAAPSRGRTKTRAVRRPRAAAARAPIDPIAGFESVVFVSEAQRTRFGNLMDEKYAPTRWLCADSLQVLGLKGAMQGLLTGTGFTSLLGMNYLTYYSITLEFLSSFTMVPDTYPLTLSFRVLNRHYEITIGDFATHLGLHCSGARTQAPDGFDPFATWACMSRTPIHNFQKVKVNDVEHPILRLWFRVIAGTFFGRPEVNVITREEVCILGRYLNVEQLPSWGFNLPLMIAQHFDNLATRKIKSIRIGGLITCLLTKMGIAIPASHRPIRATVDYINLEFFFFFHHWYSPETPSGGRWLVSKSPERWIMLPCAQLPPLQPLRERPTPGTAPSYLIPEHLLYGFNQNLLQAPPVDPAPEPSNRGRRRRRTDFGYDTMSQEGPSTVPTPPSAADLHQAEINFERRRFAHHATNQYLATLPFYHDAVVSGMIQPPYVSYYRHSADPTGIFEDTGVAPTAWGMAYGESYGGIGGQFLDQFSNLRVSGDAAAAADDDGDGDAH